MTRLYPMSNVATGTPILTTDLVKEWFTDLEQAICNKSFDARLRVEQELCRMKLYVQENSVHQFACLVKRNYPLGFVTDILLYSESGRVQISLMRHKNRICLVSENGNVPTFSRVLFKYIRLLYELLNINLKDIKARLEHNRKISLR